MRMRAVLRPTDGRDPCCVLPSIASSLSHCSSNNADSFSSAVETTLLDLLRPVLSALLRGSLARLKHAVFVVVNEPHTTATRQVGFSRPAADYAAAFTVASVVEMARAGARDERRLEPGAEAELDVGIRGEVGQPADRECRAGYLDET